MIKIIDKLISIQNDTLNKVSFKNPKNARMTFSLNNFLLIEIINALKLSSKFNYNLPQNVEQCLDFLFKVNQINLEEKKLLYNHYAKNSGNFETIKIKEISIDQINTFELYEFILKTDIAVENEYYKLNYDNKARDRAGAYYTSHNFALAVVEKTIEKYILKKSNQAIASKENILTIEEILFNTKIIDMSCGTGNFLFAVLEYLKNKYKKNINIDALIKNLYGFDIDILALKILITEMTCRATTISILKEIKQNYVLGNTLINNLSSNYKNKIISSLTGMIYNKDMGINHEKYLNNFDIVVGNPPWEKVRFEDKNFFQNYDPSIAKLTKKDERIKGINNLKISNPNLKEFSDLFSNEIKSVKEEIKSNDLFQYSSFGELNTYALFTELGFNFLKDCGEICLIIKSSMVTSKSNQRLFNYFTKNKHIDAIYDFINKKKIFPIDSRERFTVIYLNKSIIDNFEVRMNLLTSEDMFKKDNLISMNYQDLELINPETKMMPNFKSIEELKLLKKYSKKFNIFSIEFKEAKFGRLVHFTNHADFISKNLKENYIPIYEGKFIERYDNKFSTFDGLSADLKYKSKASARYMTEEEKQEFKKIPQSRFYLESDKWKQITKNYLNNYSLFWRSTTSASNKRVTLATILPHTPTSQSLQLLQYNNDIVTLGLILSLFNSVVFDYFVKLKLGGIDLTQAIIKQIPVPSINKFHEDIEFKKVKTSLKNHILSRILNIYNNDFRLKDLKDKFNIDDHLNFKENKHLLILELDVLISIAYGITKEELKIMLNSFSKCYTEKDKEYIMKLK